MQLARAVASFDAIEDELALIDPEGLPLRAPRSSSSRRSSRPARPQHRSSTQRPTPRPPSARLSATRARRRRDRHGPAGFAEHTEVVFSILERGELVRERTGLWLWPLLASARLRAGFSQHWKRILVGAFVGWLLAVVAGAIALAALELNHVISRTTSDDLGVILVLYGVGLRCVERVHVQAATARRTVALASLCPVSGERPASRHEPDARAGVSTATRPRRP